MASYHEIFVHEGCQKGSIRYSSFAGYGLWLKDDCRLHYLSIPVMCESHLYRNYIHHNRNQKLITNFEA